MMRTFFFLVKMRWTLFLSASQQLVWEGPRLLRTELILFIILGLLWPKNTSARILYITVPRTVNVDQTNEAILDCQYDHSHELNDLVVVKWFFNNDHLPIYTWLPNTQTRNYDSQFERFMDKSFRFSADRYQIYRGIRFAHLHPNLTGVYHCTVSSKEGYFEDRKAMTLYRTPHFEKFEVTSNARHFNITCDVHRIMRPGEVRIYIIKDNHFVPLDADITLTPQDDTFQSMRAQVHVNYTVDPASNATSFQFQCTIVYPNTDINVTRNRHMTMMRSSSIESYVSNVFYILCGLIAYSYFFKISLNLLLLNFV